MRARSFRALQLCRFSRDTSVTPDRHGRSAADALGRPLYDQSFDMDSEDEASHGDMNGQLDEEPRSRDASPALDYAVNGVTDHHRRRKLPAMRQAEEFIDLAPARPAASTARP